MPIEQMPIQDKSFQKGSHVEWNVAGGSGSGQVLSEPYEKNGKMVVGVLAGVEEVEVLLDDLRLQSN